jgi:hypothetical protein
VGHPSDAGVAHFSCGDALMVRKSARLVDTVIRGGDEV